jgi:hypothetical protein
MRLICFLVCWVVHGLIALLHCKIVIVEDVKENVFFQYIPLFSLMLCFLTSLLDAFNSQSSCSTWVQMQIGTK